MRDDKGKFSKKIDGSVEQEISPSLPPEKKEEASLKNLFDQPLNLKSVLILIIVIWLLAVYGRDILSPINDKVKDFVSSHYCGNYTASRESIANPTPKKKEG